MALGPGAKAKTMTGIFKYSARLAMGFAGNGAGRSAVGVAQRAICLDDALEPGEESGFCLCS